MGLVAREFNAPRADIDGGKLPSVRKGSLFVFCIGGCGRRRMREAVDVSSGGMILLYKWRELL